MSAFKETLLGGGAVTVAPQIRIEQPQPPKIAICVPSFSQVQTDWSQAYAALCAYMVGRSSLAMLNEKSSMVSMARNNLVQRALDIGAEWIFQVDSDLVFPCDAIERLMRHNKDIAGATYNKRVPPFETLGRLKGPVRDVSAGGLAEAEYMPGGFMLYKAEIFKKVPWPWFYESFWSPAASPMDSFILDLKRGRMTPIPKKLEAELRKSERLQAWVEQDAKAIPVNRALSEDYGCSKQMRAYGFSIWCDLDLTWQLKHIGEQHVSCSPPGQKAVDPATVPMPPRPPSAVVV